MPPSRSGEEEGMRVSVIIPALNEEAQIAATIRAVRAEKPHEITVVDGGSTDRTRAEASAADVVLAGPRGRALQMNHGAAQATGDLLLFLHADCRLTPGALAVACRTISRRGVIAGCFRMRVDAVGALYRAIGVSATARVRLTGIAYGDQGLFLTRETFARLGGFPPLRLMEDVFLSLKLRRMGRVVVAPADILVSPRRWQQQGIVRQTLRNWTLTALAAAGVHPDRLAHFYPTVR
jgi:rSAM/selenodomain-associated transferase 2